MILLHLFWCVAGVPTLLAQNCPNQGISNHVIIKEGRYRLSSLKRGNYTIQGLISVTDDTKNERKITCEHVTRAGLMRTYAMRYVIDQINNDFDFIPSATLGLQIDNVCRSLPVAMARGIEIISQHRPNSVCRADFLKCTLTQYEGGADMKPAAGIVGTGMSFSSIPLASLMSLYVIPEISFSASSKLLSNKDVYKSFFRTIPSDKKQIIAIVDVIKRFRWNYVIAIGSDDDYGKLGVADLKENAKERDICIVHDAYIPYGSTKTKATVDAVVEKIEDQPDAEVIVLFCYVKGIGDLILQEAKSKGIKRVWLTSEVWNPTATDLPNSLMNQIVGILTISIKSYPMTYIIDYMKKEITTNWQCDMWLQLFMDTKWNCKPQNISADKTTLYGDRCNVTIETIMNELSLLYGDVYNIVNSVTALAHGIRNYLKEECPSDTTCSISNIKPAKLTKLMYKVKFTNDEGNVVSFDKDGDPKHAYYTIENIQYINDKFVYIPVGNWSDNRTDRLLIDKDRIQWPLWFANNTQYKHPFSRCNPDCKHGEHVIEKVDCCWKCKNCTSNFYTNRTNAMNCSDCGLYYHTFDNKKCILTDIRWLTIEDAPGMSLIIISAIGFLIATITSCILLKYWRLAIIRDATPHMTILCCLILFVSYAYGGLHIIMPSQHLCSAMSAIFYLLLMLYTAILMVQTKFWNLYMMEGVTKFLKGNVFRCQMISLLGYLLVQGASVTAWLVNEGNQVLTYKDNSPGIFLLRTQCRVEATAARYISTFIPIIILIIATFCAFRERNGEHCFHEPKFLSFSCIALCIIIIAYMPTFQFVDGRYKSIVMAIAIDVFGCTFLICLVLPKIYVGIMRDKRGPAHYPLKPGSDPKEEPVIEEKSTKGVSQISVSGAETSITKDLSETSPSITDGKYEYEKGDTNPSITDGKYEYEKGEEAGVGGDISNGQINAGHDFENFDNNVK